MCCGPLTFDTPLNNSWIYLALILGLFSRNVLNSNLSNPSSGLLFRCFGDGWVSIAIFRSDQGNQWPYFVFMAMSQAKKMRIS